MIITGNLKAQTVAASTTKSKGTREESDVQQGGQEVSEYKPQGKEEFNRSSTGAQR